MAGLAFLMLVQSPMAEAAPTKCARLLPTGTREVIINQCSNAGSSTSFASALVIKCKACKAALIERQNRTGGNGKRHAYKVAPQSAIEVLSKGAAQIALLAEVDCP